jgi:hypothetical protein
MRLSTIAVLLLAGTTMASSFPAFEGSPVERARWLAGCWELQRGSRTGFEMWMPPAGGIMMGASRTVSGGKVVEWERLQLSEQEGKLVYTSLPSGQTEASFSSTVLTDTSFTVENLQHDFPQRISYRRHGADSLIARIEGPQGGSTRGIDFPMRRISCEAR